MMAIDGHKIATFARPRGALDALPLGGSSFTPREVILTSEFQATGERLVVPIEEAKLHLGSYNTLPDPACSSVLGAPTTSMYGHLHASFMCTSGTKNFAELTQLEHKAKRRKR